MVKKKKRKLKIRNIIMMFIFLSLIIVSIFYLKEYLNLYKVENFSEMGYQTDEITFILSLSDEEKDIILNQEKIENIIKHYTIENYTEFTQIGYSDSEITQILDLDQTIQEYLLAQPYMKDIFNWLRIDNFIFNNIDRYQAYQEKYPKLLFEEVLEKVNTNRDNPYYSNIQPSDTSLGNLVLVNKYYALSEDYTPSDLISVSPYGSVKMVREAAEAFIELCDHAKEDGYTIKGISGYRSYQTQYNLYNRYLQKDPQNIVDTYSARAGHSEHQTGLAIDVSSNNPDILTFEMSSSFKWMKDHAHLYGFILRFEKGKEDITGYKYEPWHYRYVGKEIATLLYQTGLTFDEYVAINLMN